MVQKLFIILLFFLSFNLYSAEIVLLNTTGSTDINNIFIKVNEETNGEMVTVSRNMSVSEKTDEFIYGLVGTAIFTGVGYPIFKWINIEKYIWTVPTFLVSALVVDAMMNDSIKYEEKEVNVKQYITYRTRESVERSEFQNLEVLTSIEIPYLYRYDVDNKSYMALLLLVKEKTSDKRIKSIIQKATRKRTAKHLKQLASLKKEIEKRKENYLYSIGQTLIVSDPKGAKIEIGSDLIGEAPVWVDLDSYNQYSYSKNVTVRAYPLSPGQQTQTKFVSFDKRKPKKIYFDMNLVDVKNNKIEVPEKKIVEHWVVTNLKGYSAYSPNFQYTSDQLYLQKQVISFTDKGGSVSGTDSKIIKIDDSTLMGFGGNDQGTTLVEVYQINRKHKKLQYTATRVGSDALFPGFPDKVTSMIGDARLVDR